MNAAIDIRAVAEPAAEQDSATSETATSPPRESGVHLRLQGNWKRREGVATRYELAVAIDALLERGKVVIDGGLLTLPKRGELRMRLSLASVGRTREDRWRRADEELERYCQTMEVSETRSRRAGETTALAESTFEAAVLRGSPRKGVGKYVLRELRDGPCDYEVLIMRIHERGGWEWVNESEDTARARETAKKAKTKGKRGRR